MIAIKHTLPVVKFKSASMFPLNVVKKSLRGFWNMSSGSKKKLDRLKVAVLGRSGSGKTALTVRFLTRRFIGDYERNKENTYQQDVDIDGAWINLEILDTRLDIQDCLEVDASFERTVKWADAFIIVYDVTDAKSLRAVPHIKAAIDQVRRSKAPPVVAILVGNKVDLVQSRVVTYNEGLDLATLLSLPFFEVSVRESYEDVVGLFSALSREVRTVMTATTKPSMFRGLRERSKKKGRFAMLTRQRSVSM
ncbi:ras-like protein family member 11B [Patiria miniata]|uniref:small monomeric GTPase n=1 Tax=Patiria miniata TaxID=46514 RepID=A0A914BRY4_PATMI|nr:ras-like protein family member 11B [Patiria miniata]